MHKPTYQQPAKNQGKAEGQAQKPATSAQPFDKENRAQAPRKDSQERDQSPQQQSKQAAQGKPQATQEENNTQKREPKQS
ncbi:hypothetical protein [Metapseudomonas furukawaii]